MFSKSQPIFLSPTSWDNQVRCWEISRSGTSLASAPKASIYIMISRSCVLLEKMMEPLSLGGGCDKQAKMWPLFSGRHKAAKFCAYPTASR
ncbi:hypothetical protein Bca52824_050599 [Brassica carinata]|uniref:Uncharacterized protein n=1 Tax=Brassica carinata TaxID=52824 RepID=A0A8X7QYP9_BRACI|nr:hypothetical protein Bca52824_050599 [Brassica carinata]